MAIAAFKTNNVFGIQSNDLKIEYSKFSMQAFDEYAFVSDPKQIMYLYYTFRAFRRDMVGEWMPLFEVNAYDFPALIDFEIILKKIINKDISIEHYTAIPMEEANIQYSILAHTGNLNDDYYSVRHTFSLGNIKELNGTYEITFGETFDPELCEGKNIVFKNLSEADLVEVHSFISDIIQHIMDENNEKYRHYIKSRKWRVNEGKLYEYCDNGTEIENVFMVGDSIDFATYYNGDIDSDNYYSTTINSSVISRIDNDNIVFSGGYIVDTTGDYTVPVNRLIYLFANVDIKALCFNENEIAADFIKVLSDTEKHEFITLNENELFYKWKEAIMNRTWMCRDEHNLPKRVKDTGNHENVYASIYEIVKIIKTQLAY